MPLQRAVQFKVYRGGLQWVVGTGKNRLLHLMQAEVLFISGHPWMQLGQGKSQNSNVWAFLLYSDYFTSIGGTES